ncbi:hypothetical protein BZA77DRAFT_309996 [Pyronema omphalodes]|nr:hypothetical protein BZA77DRAFT_309996 [Pyronema omphalodes]
MNNTKIISSSRSNNHSNSNSNSNNNNNSILLPKSAAPQSRPTIVRQATMAEDKQILNNTQSLSQFIQQHVTNFYETPSSSSGGGSGGGDITKTPNPFAFVPLSAKCFEVALRRRIANDIVEFIHHKIKGVGEEGIEQRHLQLFQELEPYKNRTTDEEKRKEHLFALFETGDKLAEMLASGGKSWKFGAWDDAGELCNTERLQMKLLVFPGLFKNERCVRAGELGTGIEPMGRTVTRQDTYRDQLLAIQEANMAKPGKQNSWGSRKSGRTVGSQTKISILSFVLQIFQGLTSIFKRVTNRGPTTTGSSSASSSSSSSSS